LLIYQYGREVVGRDQMFCECKEIEDTNESTSGYLCDGLFEKRKESEKEISSQRHGLHLFCTNPPTGLKTYPYNCSKRLNDPSEPCDPGRTTTY